MMGLLTLGRAIFYALLMAVFLKAIGVPDWPALAGAVAFALLFLYSEGVARETAARRQRDIDRRRRIEDAYAVHTALQEFLPPQPPTGEPHESHRD